MDQTLKNRLVGAAVLLVLAVILLPLLFDGANRDALLAGARMPAPPAVPEAGALLDAGRQELAAAQAEVAQAHAPAEPEPLPPVAMAPVPQAQPSPAPAAAPAGVPAPQATPATAPAAAAAPAADERLARLAEAWDVQLAAVSAAEGAERLRGKLAAAGYKARVRRDGDRYKVVVGPELRREDAQALLATLAADARVGKPSGLLVRYIP